MISSSYCVRESSHNIFFSKSYSYIQIFTWYQSESIHHLLIRSLTTRYCRFSFHMRQDFFTGVIIFLASDCRTIACQPPSSHHWSYPPRSIPSRFHRSWGSVRFMICLSHITSHLLITWAIALFLPFSPKSTTPTDVGKCSQSYVLSRSLFS